MSTHPRLALKGFSLVELVTLLTIIAVLAAIAGPRYANSLALYRVQAAAQRIAADINLTRSQAKITSLGQTIVFNTASNSYSMPGMNGLAGQPSPYTVQLASEPYQSILSTATFGVTSTEGFDQYGQPTSGGTVVVQSGAFTKNVIVDANTGMASVQ